MRARAAVAHEEPLDRSVDHLLEECRMVLPGVQALFGFQLIAVFNEPFFTMLNPGERMVHLMALILVSVAVALLMAPAAYHRQAEPERVSPRLVAYTSRMLMLAMVPLMLAVPLDVYLIARVVCGDVRTALPIALGVFLLFGWLWFVLPWRVRATWRGRARRPARG